METWLQQKIAIHKEVIFGGGVVLQKLRFIKFFYQLLIVKADN